MWISGKRAYVAHIVISGAPESVNKATIDSEQEPDENLPRPHGQLITAKTTNDKLNEKN